MSKTKSLLSFALAATMLFSTVFVGANAEDATPKTGTLKIGTATVEVGTPTATVDFTLTFTEAVEAPHELATIVAMNENDEALTITDVVLGDVTYSDGYVDENLDVNDPELEVPALRIKTDGINKTAGKVLFESGVDSAVKASVINFTVTFDTTNATVGTYTVSAVIDSTDLDESEIVVTAEDGAIVVAEPHVCSAGEATDNGDGTHDIACAGCDKLFADNEACKYVDGACSVCGAADPDYVPDEPECDHEWEVNDYTAATYGTDGTDGVIGNISLICSECGAQETSDSVAYQGLYSFLQSSASYEDAIILNFTASKTWLPSDYDEFIVIMEKDVVGGEPIIATYEYSDGDFSGTINVGSVMPYARWTYPIAAKEMNDVISACVFTKVNGVWYNGNAMEVSFASYAKQVFNMSNVSTEEKTLLANAMNYGGKAQIYFEYDDTNPAYNHIPSEYQNLVKTEVLTPAKAEARVPDFSVDKIAITSSSISAESRTEMNHYFIPYNGFEDIDNLYFNASFTNASGEHIETVLVSSNVATEQQLKDGNYFFFSHNLTATIPAYKLIFGALAAKDMRCPVTFTPCVGDDTVAVPIVLSVENLIAELSGKISEAESAMYNAMLHYGDSAEIMFG